MSYIGKTTNSGNGVGTINTDVVFNGKVYQANNNYFNLQYGDQTSLANILPNWSQGYSNTAIGMNTCPALTTGYSNTVVGSYAMNKNTTGYQNTALGSAALYNNNGGYFNVAVGNDAMLQSWNGNNNCAVGKGSMFGGGGAPSGLTYSNNTAVGNTSLFWLTSGNDNVAVGSAAGTTTDTGSRNTFLGTTANTSGGSYNQSTALGYGANITASNQVVLGTAAETVICPNILKAVALNINSTQQINGFAKGSFSPSSNAAYSLSFGYTFSSAPIVTATLYNRGSATCACIIIDSVTTTGCSVSVLNTAGSHCETSWTINWTAIG